MKNKPAFTAEEKTMFEAFMAAPEENQRKALSLMSDMEREGFQANLFYYKLFTLPDFYKAAMNYCGEAFLASVRADS